MERNMFSRFASGMKCMGVDGVGAPGFSLGHEGKFDLAYIPFEHVNPDARLVIVGITPGNTQLELAYAKARELLLAGQDAGDILVEVKKAGTFGGKSMKPNLLKILRHFQFEKLLGIADVETLWGTDADLLHSTSVVPHAAFKNGKPFNGGFDEILASSLLKGCFLDCFVPSAQEMNRDALFVALGPCPQAALEWCVKANALRPEQVLGSFCHPSSTGGSTTDYYLREVSKDELDPRNPVRNRCDWLDQAYGQMFCATSSRLGVESKAHSAAKAESTPPPVSSKQSAILPKTLKAKPANGLTRSIMANGADVETILKEIERAGYRLMNTTSKLSEFQLSGGPTFYFVKTTSRLNGINLMVHPGLKPEALRSIEGVDSVDPEHRFHSNMTRFPKLINRGKTETAYGWQIRIGTLADLPRFLKAFKSVGF